ARVAAGARPVSGAGCVIYSRRGNLARFPLRRDALRLLASEPIPAAARAGFASLTPSGEEGFTGLTVPGTQLGRRPVARVAAGASPVAGAGCVIQSCGGNPSRFPLRRDARRRLASEKIPAAARAGFASLTPSGEEGFTGLTLWVRLGRSNSAPSD